MKISKCIFLVDGVLYKLGTRSSESVAHRLSTGLVRAMIASFLEFDFLMETFLTKGHEGLEAELEQALMPNIIEKHMNKDSKEYKQLTKVKIFIEKSKTF
jgi:hypothetical protein